jgi:uncharacterized protein YbjT (DUF2867 family)
MHWLAEQVLDWSGLPVTHVRPTMFMENPLLKIAFDSIAKTGTIRLSFGAGRHSDHSVAGAGRGVFWPVPGRGDLPEPARPR